MDILNFKTHTKEVLTEKLLPCFEKLFSHHHVDNGPNFDELATKICDTSKTPISNMDAYHRISFTLDISMYPSFDKKNESFMKIVNAFVDAYLVNQELDVDLTLKNILTGLNMKEPLVYNKEDVDYDKHTDNDGYYVNPSWFAIENFYEVPFKVPLNFHHMFIDADIIKDGLLKINLDNIKPKSLNTKKQRKTSTLNG